MQNAQLEWPRVKYHLDEDVEQNHCKEQHLANHFEEFHPHKA